MEMTSFHANHDMLKRRLEDSESYAKFKMVAVTICFSAMTM